MFDVPLNPLSLSEDEWKDKYLKICEKTIQKPTHDCITGALVSQLNTNVSPVIVENEMIEELKTLDGAVCKQNSLDSKLKRRRVIKTAKYSDAVISQRKKSYSAILAKENLDELAKLQKSFEKAIDLQSSDTVPEEENIYEEITNYRPRPDDNDLYVLPIDTFHRGANLLTRHAGTWPNNKSATMKIHQKLSLQNSILVDENNKKYVEFDGEIKNLIKKLISNIDDHSLDDQSKKDLEKLQRFTDNPILPRKSYARKYSLRRQAPVVEEEEEQEDIYIEMLGSPCRSPRDEQESNETDGNDIYEVPRPAARKVSSTGEISKREGNPIKALPKFGAAHENPFSDNNGGSSMLTENARDLCFNFNVNNSLKKHEKDSNENVYVKPPRKCLDKQGFKTR